ncbi:MAG: two-component regulator propeller domain-containing protein [Bacteroidia bacterium]
MSFTSLNVNDGLSQNTVTCIYQDIKGLMWLGTQEGLNSYDGYVFKTYKHNPDNDNSLSSSAILCITENKDNTLWIGTDGGGLNLLNLLNGKFSHFEKNDSVKNSISSNRVKNILFDSKGRTWIATFGAGINYFDKVTGKFFEYLPDSVNKKSFSNFVVKIIEDKKHRLWLTTRNGFYQFIPETKKFIEINLNPEYDTISPPPRLTDLAEDDSGLLFIASANQGIFSYDADKNSVQKFSIENFSSRENFVNKLLFDSQGNLWIGYMNEGVDVIDVEHSHFIHYEKTENNKYSICGNHTASLFEDHSGLMWAGTFGNGVSIADLKTKRLSAFRFHPASRNINEKLNIYNILNDGNHLFLATNESGLYVYDKNDSIYSFKESSAKFSIPKNDVWSLLKTDGDNFLLGTYGKGLSNFNLNDKIFSPVSYKALADSTRFNASFILCLMRDSRNKIWIATQRNGMYAFDAQNDSLQHYQPGENNFSISDATVLAVFEDDKKNIWAGTFENGFDVINTTTNEIKNYRFDAKNKNTPGSNSTTCFYQQKNVMWFGTIGGGLNAFNLSTQKFTRFTEEQGLPDITVYGISPDETGSLWISTNKGISKITPAISDTSINILCRNYDVNDGLPANEFNQGAYFKDKNGVLYFGSVNGLVSFRPELINNNNSLPPVLLTSFKIFEKEYSLDTAVSYKKTITLNYNQDFFSFEFAALSYFLAQRNQYEYMLEGFDKKWINIGNRHFVSFTNLSPDQYTLKIKAANNDGVWNDNPTVITIIINPPFWMTWWFRITVVTIIALIIYLIVNVRIKRIRKEERRKSDSEKRIAQVETKALRAQMNPHFIFNSLNAIHKYVWDREQTLASDYLTRFSKLMRMILENSLHQKISLDKELEALKIYIELECLRFDNKFSFEINCNTSNDAEDVQIPPLLLQPFVENAIIHGLMNKQSGYRNLKVEISDTNKQLLCIVEDSGIGRAVTSLKAKTKHRSLGMTVTKERIEIMNIESDQKTEMHIKDLIDENGNATGTRVEIILPLDLAFD